MERIKTNIYLTNAFGYLVVLAIDTEFTGLASQESQRPSLFDSPSERYKKLKRTVNQFLTCQFGRYILSVNYLNSLKALIACVFPRSDNLWKYL